MIVLGIDPAANSGLAVVDGKTGDLIWHRRITPGISTADRLEILQSLPAEIGAAVIEVPPNMPGAYHSAGQVHIRAGEWRSLLSLAGLPAPREVRPAEWRARVNMPFAGRKRETLKRMAVDFAKRQWAVTLTEDEADAALIALAYTQ
jgi:hypothetical protein